ncbi:MAG: hypothetical protein AAFN11_23360, partial [Chloroflexota bacterium]
WSKEYGYIVKRFTLNCCWFKVTTHKKNHMNVHVTRSSYPLSPILIPDRTLPKTSICRDSGLPCPPFTIPNGLKFKTLGNTNPFFHFIAVYGTKNMTQAQNTASLVHSQH